jgi:type IV pilus assembly protein PilA
MYKWRGQRKRHLFGREEGFTLTEILITIVILGILAAIAIPIYNAQRTKSDDMVLKANLIAAATNIEQSKTAFGGKYPSTIAPAGKEPIAKANDAGVSFNYTIPYDRTNYCLEGTYEGKKLYISHTTQAPGVNDCTYTYVTPAPENFFVSVDLSFIPKARWDAIVGADSYNVYKDGTKIGSFTSTSGNLTAMAPGSTANYWVRAVVSGAETDDSNKMTITAPVPPPATAPVLTTSQTADNGAAMTTTNRLSWTPVTWATSYLLYDADTDQLLNPGSGSATTFNVAVEKETVKKYYVIASNVSGNGPKSNIVTIAPKFVTPILAGTVDDFTLKADFSWQTMVTTYGTGATAKVFVTDNSFTSGTVTGNTYSTTQGRVSKIWKVRITTGNGTVLDSNAVTLDPKGLPDVSVIYQGQYQNLDRTMVNPPSYFGLNSANSTWKVEVSDTTAFTKVYPQSSESGTDPNDTFSGMVAPTHGGTYYVRYVITRKSDGQTIASPTKSISIPTRSLDVNNNGNRDILALYTWNGNQNIFIIPTNTGGVGMNPGGSVVDPRGVGQDCTVYPVMDFTKPGSQGFICWRHNTNIDGYPGSIDYYEFQANGTIGAPWLLGNGWNMYDKLTVVQNFYGDDYPSILAGRPDGGLEVWRGGAGGLKSVDRNSGSGWHLAGSDTSVIKGIYDWNGYGSVGVMATTRYSPFQRYYPSNKIPTGTGAQQMTTFVNQNGSWNTIAGVTGYFPTDSNPNGCCSYVYSRQYGNMVSGSKILPVVGFGPKTYYDAFWGNGAGSFGGGATNWGYPAEGYMGYPEEWKPIR